MLYRIGDRLGRRTNGALVEWMFGSRDSVAWVDCLVPLLLKIRSRIGRLEYLAPNRAQQHYA
ncbi:MAG: hypothetical protein ACRD5F_03960, partial [Candidatus Acidiferrales bacterium]